MSTNQPTRTDDLVEIQQLIARYAVTITQEDIDGLVGVFGLLLFESPLLNTIEVGGGFVNPTAVRFAPDGRAFVAEKRGIVKAFDSIADTTPTTVIDLRTATDDYWDRASAKHHDPLAHDVSSTRVCRVRGSATTLPKRL